MLRRKICYFQWHSQGMHATTCVCVCSRAFVHVSWFRVTDTKAPMQPAMQLFVQYCFPIVIPSCQGKCQLQFLCYNRTRCVSRCSQVSSGVSWYQLSLLE